MMDLPADRAAPILPPAAPTGPPPVPRRIGDLDIPEELSEQAKEACRAILACVEARTGKPAPTGFGRAFYAPSEWESKGNEPVQGALVLVVHDGGPLAPFFNLDYEAYADAAAMDHALTAVGTWVEYMATWYSAIYPSCQKQDRG